MDRPVLGELELEVLRFVADHQPLTVGQAAKAFGVPRGLARTTILTVMERLRIKGYLERKKQGAVYAYAPTLAKEKVLQGLVAEFVRKRLAGSLAPFVAYLAEARNLTDKEVAELEALLDES